MVGVTAQAAVVVVAQAVAAVAAARAVIVSVHNVGIPRNTPWASLATR